MCGSRKDISMNKNKTVTVDQLEALLKKDERFENVTEDVGDDRVFVYSNTGWTLFGEGCHSTYFDFDENGKSTETIQEIKNELDNFVETPNDK